MLKKYFRWLAIISTLVIIINSINQAQEKISITGSGGINYIPMKEFSNYLFSLSNSLVSNVDEISFSGTVKFNYYFNQNHSIYLGVDYLSSNASLAGGFAVFKWVFQTVPLSTGYEYSIAVNPESLKYYFGCGIIYSFFENIEKINSDVGEHSESFNDYSFGFEFKSGIKLLMAQDIFALVELKYRYLGDYMMNSYNNFDQVNLSGLGLHVGLMLSIL